MENFVVSARKYRPSTFDTVVGQEAITRTLKNAIKGKQIAHAYLFCGPRGVGKTTCARIFAKTINCFNITANQEACDTCESCLAFNKSRSYNIHELDAASNNSVDDIRNLIDQIRIPPQIGKYSIYIIDEVHMLSSSAFNSFLKTLEEPPAHAIFILATTEKHKIIPTILSRCQIYDFHRITLDDIIHYLQHIAKNEGVDAEPEALAVIASKSDGAMRDALSIFDQMVSFAGKKVTYKHIIDNLNILDYDYYFRLIDAFLNGDLKTTLLLYDEILHHGFDSQFFITGLSGHLRDILICKDAETIKLLETSASIRDKYKESAQLCSTGFLFKALNIMNHCDLYYKSSSNKRLHVELALFQLCEIIKKNDRAEEETGEHSTASPEPARKKEKAPSPAPDEKKNLIPDKKPDEPSLKSISIKQTLQGKPDVNTKENNVIQEPAIETSEDIITPFSQDELNAKWLKYAETLKKTKPRMYSTLSIQYPVLKENFFIELKLSNETQVEEFSKEIKNYLLNFLKKELNNSKINLSASIEQQKTQVKKTYTMDERYNIMKVKNPNLEKLKNQFNLEFD